MRKFYVLFFLVVASINSFAQPAISYQPFITGLTAPVELVNAGDGSNRLFIVQQNGIIRVYDPGNGGLQSTPFLDISTLITYGGEQGLLSLAFHPGYATNGYFFVYYNNSSGDVTVARYHISADPNIADASNSVVLLTIPKPFTNHNGGHLQFGKDGNLYFATGDGGSGNDPNNNAQNGLSLLGKMIRINVNDFTTPPYYTVPSTNPFVGNASFDSRIWAYGLRNPYRWSFDRLTGDMWIGDVGQDTKEEVDYRPVSSTGGENYGWRCYEGFGRNPGVAACDPPNYVPPIFDYPNPNPGSSSVIGGYVYRGPDIPQLYGWYLTTDFFSGTVYFIKSDGVGGWTITSQSGLQTSVSSFGEAENGALYTVGQGTGTIYKIVQSNPLPVVLKEFTATTATAGTTLKWMTGNEQPGEKFIVEYSADGSHFTRAGEVAAVGAASGSSYSFAHAFTAAVPLYYRLQLVEGDRSYRYSPVVKVGGRKSSLQVYPTVVHNGLFYVSSSEKIEKVQVVNSNGMTILEKRLQQINSPVPVQLPALAKGIYIVHVYGVASGSYRIMVD